MDSGNKDKALVLLLGHSASDRIFTSLNWIKITTEFKVLTVEEKPTEIYRDGQLHELQKWSCPHMAILIEPL